MSNRFHWAGLVLALIFATMGGASLSMGLQAPASLTASSHLESATQDSRALAPNDNDNLTPNPSFEIADPADNSKPDRWTPQTQPGSDAEFYWYEGIAYSGTRSVGISSGRKNSIDLWGSDAVTITPGTRYYFSGWIQNSPVDGESFVAVVFLDADDEELVQFESTHLDAYTGWTKVSGNAVAPANAAKAYLGAYLDGSGVAAFDGVYLGTAEQAPIMRIALDDTPDPVNADTEITYTLHITNEGNLSELAFTVTLTLDEHLIFRSATIPTTTISGTQLIWIDPFAPLEAGQSQSITVVADLEPGLEDGTQLHSIAGVDGQRNGEDEDDEFTSVHSAPEIALSKTAPMTVAADHWLTYTIRVTNTGNATATLVVLVDEYPPNPNCLETAGLPLFWSHHNLEPGTTATKIISGFVAAECPSGTLLNNRVTAQYASQEEATAVAQTLVEGSEISYWELTLRAPGPGRIWPHEAQSYRFEVENVGNRPITNTVMSISNTLAWPAAHFAISPTLIENLAPGEQQSISVTGTAPRCEVSGTLNFLTLTASGSEDTHATAAMSVTVGAHQSGLLQDGASHTISPSTPLTLTRLVTNTGTTTTTFWLINDEQSMPQDWYAQWTPTQTVTLAPCQSGSRDLTIIPPHEHMTATILTKLTSAPLGGDLFDVAIDNIHVEALWELSLIPWDTDIPCQVRPDQPTLCRVQLHNTGNQTLTNLSFVMSDALHWPEESFAYQPQTLPDVGPGTSRTLTITTTAPGYAMVGTTNTLTVTALHTPAIVANTQLELLVAESVSAMITVPDLPTALVPGQPTGLVFTLTNTGNATTSFTMSANESLTWGLRISPTLVSELGPGHSQSIALSGGLSTCVLSGTLNTLTISATPTGGAAPIVTATHPLIAGQWISAQITEGSTYVVVPSQTLTLTHHLTNTGNTTTTLELHSAMPAGWTIDWQSNPLPDVPACGGMVTVRGTVTNAGFEHPGALLTTTVTLQGAPTPPLAQAVDHVQVKWFTIYLPLCLKQPPVPATPQIAAINNRDANGDYTVEWNATEHASYYVLEQAGNISFDPRTEVAHGAETSYAASIPNAQAGMVYYHVRACNTEDKCSPWSEAALVEAWYEQEPNDSTNPNGPLISGMQYHGRPELNQEDMNDYYWFTMGSAGQITLELDGYTGKGGWLLIYYNQVHQPPAEAAKTIATDGTCTITYTGAPGTYYVRIYTESEYNDTPYNLTVSFPQSQQHILREGVSLR